MNQNKKSAIRMYAWQIGLIVLVAGVLGLLKSWQVAYSLLLGGICCAVPGWYFAYSVFKYSGAQAAKKIARSFYLGEMVKMFLTFFLFAAVFIFVPVSALALFSGFLLAQCFYWLAPWWMVPQGTKVKNTNDEYTRNSE
jgi:ATP synthase protein I